MDLRQAGGRGTISSSSVLALLVAVSTCRAFVFFFGAVDVHSDKSLTFVHCALRQRGPCRGGKLSLIISLVPLETSHKCCRIHNLFLAFFPPPAEGGAALFEPSQPKLEPNHQHETAADQKSNPNHHSTH